MYSPVSGHILRLTGPSDVRGTAPPAGCRQSSSRTQCGCPRTGLSDPLQGQRRAIRVPPPGRAQSTGVATPGRESSWERSDRSDFCHQLCKYRVIEQPKTAATGNICRQQRERDRRHRLRPQTPTADTGSRHRQQTQTADIDSRHRQQTDRHN